jgi:hypothetical protein
MRLLGSDGGNNLTDPGTETPMAEDRSSDYEVGSPARLALNVLAHKWTLLIDGGP